MKKIVKVSYLSVIAVALVFGLASFAAVAKNDNAKANSGSSSKTKNEKVKDLRDYQKPTQTKTNAAIHKEKTDIVSAELLEAARIEKLNGQKNRVEKTKEVKLNNPNIGQQQQSQTQARIEGEAEELAEEIEEVAEQTEKTQEETVQAIEKAEKENKFKKFLVGTDYKNLGQLRSSLVHNRNQIRKLTRLSEGVTEEAKVPIQEQLATLMQERERIKTVISDNEAGFSLLGWVFRFLNGYSNDSIDEQEEEQLEEEVMNAIDETNETAEETTDGTADETIQDNEDETADLIVE